MSHLLAWQKRDTLSVNGSNKNTYCLHIAMGDTNGLTFMKENPQNLFTFKYFGLAILFLETLSQKIMIKL